MKRIAITIVSSCLVMSCNSVLITKESKNIDKQGNVTNLILNPQDINVNGNKK